MTPTSSRWMVIALLVASCSGMAGDAGSGDDSSSGKGGEANEQPSDGGDGGDGGAVGAGGRGGGAGMSSAGGAGGSSNMGGSGPPLSVNPCSDDNLKITPLWDANGFRIVAGPGRTATVRVERARPAAQPEPDKWTWEVEHGGTFVSAKFAGGPECSFPVIESGHYTIVATNQYGCSVRKELRALAEGERATHLWMRVLPPESRRLTPHEQSVTLTVGGTMPYLVSLKQGLAVAVAPRRSSATGSVLEVPSFVRVVSRGSSFRWEGHTRSGTPGDGRFMAQLDPFLFYDVLVVPDQDIAPVFLKSQLAEDIAARVLQLDRGSEVSGSVTTAEGPLAGARVLLRAGDVPSTIATTDQAGRFSVLARPGRYGIVVRPADGSPLPDLVVAEASGVSVPDTGRLNNVKVNYAALPVSDVTVQVLAPNQTPLADVALELVNAAPLPAAATIEVAGGASMAANGSVVRRATTGASGKAFFAAVPRAAYTLRMVPPRAAGLARTEAAVVLDAAEQAVVASMMTPVTVTGTLATPDATVSLAGAVVTAYDAASPMDGAKTAKVDAEGRFELSLDPKREYRVRMIPPPGSALPVTPLAKLLVGTDAITLPPRTLPRAKALQGTVTDERATAVAGAIVQIYCVGDGADCFARPADALVYSAVTAVPLAEVLTDAAGKFTLNGIDPASL